MLPAAEPTPAPRPLLVGWATTDITPPRPVALVGQLTKRISTGVRDPLTATVLALEAPGDQPEQAILVSCDLLFILRETQQQVQERVRSQLPGFDATKLFANATHTHTGPGLADGTFKGLYDVSHDPRVMKASEYGEFLVERVSQAVVQAWKNRRPAAMSWAASQAVVSYNRRVQFRDGHTVMYGSTTNAEFANIEGSEDHLVNLLFFWRPDAQWTGVIINLACTAQETEHLNLVSADFWHEARQELRGRHGTNLFVLPQCAPAGDLSPHPVYRKAVEEAMDRRRGLSRRQEIARRIANAVDDALPVAQAHRQTNLVFRHLVASARIPSRSPSRSPFTKPTRCSPSNFTWCALGRWPWRPFLLSSSSITASASRRAARQCRRFSCSSPRAPAVICRHRVRCPPAATAPTNTASAPKAGRCSSRRRSGRSRRCFPEPAGKGRFSVG